MLEACVFGSSEKPPLVPSAAIGVRIGSLDVRELSNGGSYARDAFGGFIDEDGDRCDTRCEVLARQLRKDIPGLPHGGWLSSYDGYSTDDASELDIDHVVSLREAWVSGADRWSDRKRRSFANDLSSPELRAVTAAMNRSKGDKDPATWQPPSTGDWCDYISSWVSVKESWRLSADAAEVKALQNMARAQHCT